MTIHTRLTACLDHKGELTLEGMKLLVNNAKVSLDKYAKGMFSVELFKYSGEDDDCRHAMLIENDNFLLRYDHNNRCVIKAKQTSSGDCVAYEENIIEPETLLENLFDDKLLAAAILGEFEFVAKRLKLNKPKLQTKILKRLHKSK